MPFKLLVKQIFLRFYVLWWMFESLDFFAIETIKTGNIKVSLITIKKL